MGKVSLAIVQDGIKNALQEALDHIGGLESFVGANDNVMLKPNLNGDEGYTNRELVESLIEMLLERRVKGVFIAESTFGNAQMTNIYFQKTGYHELAKKYDIKLINLNESEVIEAEVKNGLLLDKVRLAKEVYEADKIINLPNMKVHYATGVTLALKNLKGLLVRDEKRRFHEVGLDKAIADLNSIIRADLNVVDCISCMERMGPRGGDTVELNLIMAGENAAEVDYAGCLVMGYDIGEVRHIKYFIDESRIDLSAIELVGEKIEDVSYPFKKVNMEEIIPAGIAVHNKDACSSCMNAFLLSCQLLAGDLSKSVDVYMGTTIEEAGSGGDVRLGFGNCCLAEGNYDREIKGCPPYPFSLGESLKEHLD